MTRYAQQMGARFIGMLQMGGQLVFLFQDIIRCLFRYPIRFRLLVRQIDFIGAKSVPVVIITGGFILLQFGKVHEVGYHDVACLEHLTGAENFEEERLTYQYQLAFERLTELALSPGRSRNVIARARQQWM